MGSAVTNTIDFRVASLLQTIAGFFKGPSGPKCPECASVIIDDKCPNLDCPLKVAEWVTRWCSPEAVNIPALGQKATDQLAKLRLVLHPGELYELSPSDWARIDSLGTSQLTDIQAEIEVSKLAKPSALLYGLRLPGMSESLAKRLLEQFGNIAALRETKPKSLQEIDGIDETMAFEICRWFSDSVNKQALKMLEQNGFNLGEQ